MTRYWTTVVILTAAFAAGCGDRNRETANNTDQNPPVTKDEVRQPPPEQPPSSASPNGYASSRQSGAPAGAPRETSGRERADRPSAAAPRPTTAASEDRFSTAERAPRDTTRAPGAAAPAPRVEWREVTVPAGTSLALELMTALSSETAAVETPVQARLRQAVVINDLTALPAGSVLTGTVTDVERPGRVQGRARLAFRFDEVRLGAGREELRTNPLTYEAEATRGEDATKIGAGAVGGAIIGGIVGGGKGAAKGAAIGGAAGTGVVMATRGKEVTLASGTDLAATLASPLTVRVQVR